MSIPFLRRSRDSTSAETTTSQVLALKNVVKQFGEGEAAQAALRGVSLEIAPGTVTAITGQSGSGKSTLLNLAAGLERPTSGSVHLGGVPIASLGARALAKHRASHVAFIFQEYNLIRTLTVLENTCLPMELEGLRASESRPRAMKALVRVGLEGHAGKFPDQLSGGEQQRVAVARAIVEPRSLMLADEPTGALDTSNGQRVVELLRAATADGMACVVATHNPEVARQADRIIVLRDGLIISDEGH